MPTTVTTIGGRLADRLSDRYHRCYSDLDTDPDLFAQDTLFDLLPPYWRFQIVGPGRVFTTQLRSIAEGPAEIEVLRTLPTTTGFVTEHVESQHTPNGLVTARRLHLCEVRDERICAVTTYCNGGWDEHLRARHAAEAPMVRP